eukprot:3761631-Amphidinium_carterae.1
MSASANSCLNPQNITYPSSLQYHLSLDPGLCLGYGLWPTFGPLFCRGGPCDLAVVNNERGPFCCGWTRTNTLGISRVPLQVSMPAKVLSLLNPTTLWQPVGTCTRSLSNDLQQKLTEQITPGDYSANITNTSVRPCHTQLYGTSGLLHTRIQHTPKPTSCRPIQTRSAFHCVLMHLVLGVASVPKWAHWQFAQVMPPPWHYWSNLVVWVEANLLP